MPGEYVSLEISDSGCGMNEETRLRIFEPFYTTKFTGRGLGLSATLGIITSHSGALQLTSLPGNGTTFRVFLPVQNPDVQDLDAPQRAAVTTEWRGSGTVLLVEDEEIIAQVARAMLDELGFTVIAAINGREALDLYQQLSSVISMVITDIGMPIMDGYELVRELKKLSPALPIVISSGFGDTDVFSRIERDAVAGIISKPYGFVQLSEVLERAMRKSREQD